jgi:hypothetical protein
VSDINVFGMEGMEVEEKEDFDAKNNFSLILQ